MSDGDDSTVYIDDEMLKQLECPFTWDMEEIIDYEREGKRYHDSDDEEFSILIRFMEKIMAIFVCTELDDEKEKILKLLKESKEEIVEFEKSLHPEISVMAIEYIYHATSCFVYKKFDMMEELDKAFDRVNGVKFSTSSTVSTIYGCRSIGWFKYHRIGFQNTEKFIQKAISENSNCDLWYFVRGKNLRRHRRDKDISIKPDVEESSSFIKAFRLSEDVIYELYVAQMFVDLRSSKTAKNIYNKIYQKYRFDNDINIFLRLANGFIKLHNYQKALIILKKIEKKKPKLGSLDESKFNHYQGICYLRDRKFKQAIPYFEKAMTFYNIKAHRDYIICQSSLNRYNSDVTELLRTTLDKFKQLPDHQLQIMILDFGLCLWKKKDNIEEALNQLLRAVEINPMARCFTFYYDFMHFINLSEVYVAISHVFLSRIFNYPSKFSNETYDKAARLRKHCDKYNSIPYGNINYVKMILEPFTVEKS